MNLYLWQNNKSELTYKNTNIISVSKIYRRKENV